MDEKQSGLSHLPDSVVDTSLFVGIIALVFTILIALLQWNGVVTVRWGLSALLYFVLTGISVWAFWAWEITRNWRKLFRFCGSALMLVVLLIISAIGVVTQYQREHPKATLQLMSRLQVHTRVAVHLRESPSDTKSVDMLTVTLDNTRGGLPDHNVKIQLQTEVFIKEVICSPTDKFSVVDGGTNANFVILYAAELRPGEFMEANVRLAQPVSSEGVTSFLHDKRYMPTYSSETFPQLPAFIVQPAQLGPIQTNPALKHP